MHIRCPHCQNPIEVVGDSDLNEITCPSCGSHFNIASESTVSYRPAIEEIGHFQLIERVGMGHFGAVWKAHDTQLDRMVAVKIPRLEQRDSKQTEQFLREARAAAQLKHPNIVSVHEVGKYKDSVYIVSDFVEGLTLADWLTGQRPTVREAVELCVKIADALEHAHAAGIIHRDLKPSNIMIDGSGEPHLMDFGLAKRDAGEITMTVDGHVMGTPAYMSPEQARGEAHQADGRSDVYSLGVILFELLTGERPFRGNARMLLHQVIHDDAPSPRKLNGNIPKDLETICLKCLEKDPGRRYPTAAACSDDLRRFLRQEPISARPISRIERGWRWCRREPVIASLSAAVLVTLIAGISISGYFAIEERKRAEGERSANRNALISTVDAAEHNRGPAVPYSLRILEKLPRQTVLNELKSRYRDDAENRKLGLAYALAEFGEVDADFLCSQVEHSAPEEVDNFVSAFRHTRGDSLIAIAALAKEAESKQNWRLKARLATVALHLEDDRIGADMCRIDDRPDPVQRTIFIDELPVWHGDVTKLAANCRNLSDPALRSAICLAIGSMPSDRFAAAETNAWKPLFADWYDTAPDNVTHSAAGWALRQRSIELPVVSAPGQPSEKREWFVNSVGMTMLKIQPGSFDRGEHNAEQKVKLTRPFFVGDREVSVAQFQEFMDDPDGPKEGSPPEWLHRNGDTSPKGDHPVGMVSWYDAVLFSNWLSRKEGFVPCYERTGKKERIRDRDIVTNKEVEYEYNEWRLAPSRTGYRLPTEAEWEYTCRAGTTTDFACGTDAVLLQKYAVYDRMEPVACGSRLPNGWGLFDMYGNVSEWCHDWHGPYGDGNVSDPVGPSNARFENSWRVIRDSGSIILGAEFCRSGARGVSLPDHRDSNKGFRVALCSVQPVK